MGCRAAVSSTPCWGAPSEQDNEEAQEDGGAHGASLPSPCHATLLRPSPQQETRQLLQGPTGTPGAVGREQLAQGEAFSSRDNHLAGREPLPPVQAPALESLTDTATSTSSPAALDISATLYLCDQAPQLGQTIPPCRRSHCISPSAGSQRG